MGNVESIARKPVEGDVPDKVAPVVTVPSVGASMQADIGNNIVLVLQTHFAQDDRAGADRNLDILYDAIRRQKAKAEIQALEKLIDQHKKVLANNEGVAATAELDHATKLAKYNEAIKREQDAIAAIDKEARERFQATGRRGDYTETAGTRSAKNAHQQTINKIDDERKKLDAEKEKAVRELGIAKGAAEREIAACQEQIEQRRALINSSA